MTALPAIAQSSPDNSYPPGIFRDGSLNASMTSPADLHFSDPGGSEKLTFQVTNDRRSDLDVLLALYKDDQWNVIHSFGTVSPGETKTLTYAANFNYTGKTNETDRFALIGKFSPGFAGKTFAVHEDWSAYERSLRSTLSLIGVPVAILLLIILAIVMAGTLAAALGMRHDEDGEYTFRTLFFPIMRARPLAEKIADIILTPFFWIVELSLGAVLILLILAITLRGIPADIGVLVFFIGGVAAIFMPVIFLVIAWLSDYYEREPFRFVLAMFMWGVMSTLVAFFVNTTLSVLLELIIGTGLGMLVTAVIIAPIVEETAKGLGLLILAGHHEFDSMFDGILFGFAVGMGFAAIENWLYFASNAGPATVGGIIP
jgi:RsiW-degrading membrane proteinase PrsW (M82 family)